MPRCTEELVYTFMMTYVLLFFFLLWYKAIHTTLRLILMGCLIVPKGFYYMLARIFSTPFTSVALILIGYTGEGLCHAIPSLPSFFTQIGTIMTLHEVIDKMVTSHNSSAPFSLSDIMTLIVWLLAVWGAVRRRRAKSPPPPLPTPAPSPHPPTHT